MHFTEKFSRGPWVQERVLLRLPMVQERALLGLSTYENTLEKLPHFPLKRLQLYFVVQGRAPLEDGSHTVKGGIKGTC